MVDPTFSQSLAAWRPDRWAMSALFTGPELETVTAARCGVRKDRRTVVVCVYENRFAKAGGLYAVASHLPAKIAEQGGRVLVLSPLHSQLATAPPKPDDARSDSPLRYAGTTNVPFDGRDVALTLWEHEADGVRWILFQAAGFFEARGGPKGNIPYDFTAPDGSQADSRLDSDSLFAAAAVPCILNHQSLTDDIVVHIQDWQFVAAALTVRLAILAGELNTVAVVLTSHNPYDCHLPAEQLRRITNRIAPQQWPMLKRPDPDDESPSIQRDTFYECMIPLLDAPVSTVSKGFAADLTEHPIQTVHFANHLQQIFQRQGVVGVDNGLFLPVKRPVFSSGAVQQAKRGQSETILTEKADLRSELLQHLDEYLPENVVGRLDAGNDRPLAQLADSVPIFMMFGRMDPAQKGFDVLARAVERIEPGQAKFIFALEATGGVQPYIEDLHDLAASRAGDVVFISDRMLQGYMETMAGVSYCVMPSLYEPFGAATEPYLKGTPVVAHAVGGLVQQVSDFRDDSAHGTGFLYQAQCDPTVAAQAGEFWDELLDCATPKSRMANPLYQALVAALAETLDDAIRIYRDDCGSYAHMLANLHDKAMQFSWDTAADEYNALYDVATGQFHTSDPI